MAENKYYATIIGDDVCKFISLSMVYDKLGFLSDQEIINGCLINTHPSCKQIVYAKREDFKDDLDRYLTTIMELIRNSDKVVHIIKTYPYYAEPVANTITIAFPILYANEIGKPVETICI